ncbi:MAG: SH3 domain-containing protein [Bacteroidota bacterium]
MLRNIYWWFLLLSTIPSIGQAADAKMPVANETDYKYNWARPGLNIRAADRIGAEKLGVIPFGVQVHIIEDLKRSEYSVEVTAFFALTYSVNNSGMFLNGHWVKVSYNSIEGYVFDGFLSTLPPMVWIDDDSGIKYLEGFGQYVERNFASDNSKSGGGNRLEAFEQKRVYDNGLIYEKRGKIGAFEEILIIPNATLNEGELVVLRMYNSEGMCLLNDQEKPQILVQLPEKFTVGWEAEEYEFYQFGSTLVMRVTRS